jgi:hypothetical protein
MSPCRVPRALVVAAVMTGGAASAAAQSRYPAELLRDLPAGANLFAILETAQPEITTDRFNSGGLNGGEPERAGAFLASWSQTIYRAGDLSIASPRDGTPMLFPELTWWRHVDVASGPMAADAPATGLAVSLAPIAAGAAWTGALEASASGGSLAQLTPQGRPPAIARLERWGHANALVSGPLINGRLGLAIGGSWTDAITIEREQPPEIQRHAASAFTHAAFTISPERTLRGLAWLQSNGDTSIHLQATFEHRDTGNGAGWRIFGGYTGRSRSGELPAAGSLEVDRLIDGPVPLRIDRAEGDERRWAAGMRVTPGSRWRRHAITLGAGVERTSSVTAPPFAGVVAERVDGVPARLWQYTNLGLESDRHALQIDAFVQDRISLTSRAHLDAAIRFDSVDAAARGSERGIQWRTWLPSVRLHWDWGTPWRLQFVTGVSRSTDQPTLGWLAYGDPAAPSAQVFRWDGSSSGPLIARVGPGTSGDPAFSAIDPELERPITGEFVLGLESSPTTTLRLGVVGLARRQTSLIHAANTGVPIGSYRMFTIPDANADLAKTDDDQQLPVYDRLPESFGQDRFLLTNPDMDAATMGAVVVWARLSSSRFTLHVGGTASASVGSGGNRGFAAFENDQAIDGELFSNPNAQTYARGRLFNDRAYTIKLLTVYRLPWDLRLGAIVRYQDGQPFSRMVVVSNLNQGAEAIQAFANGRSRFSYRSTADVRLQKGVTAGRTRLDLILDAYNLLNMATEVEEYVVTGPRFRETTAVQPPRSFHVGVRAAF